MNASCASLRESVAVLEAEEKSMKERLAVCFFVVCVCLCVCGPKHDCCFVFFVRVWSETTKLKHKHYTANTQATTHAQHTTHSVHTHTHTTAVHTKNTRIRAHTDTHTHTYTTHTPHTHTHHTTHITVLRNACTLTHTVSNTCAHSQTRNQFVLVLPKRKRND